MFKRSFIAFLIFLQVFPNLAFSQTYPQFDVSGYKKWRFYKTNVTPSSNYYLAQTHLGTLSSSLSSGPWEERLSLKIDSKLSEHLSVSYDIEQEPETPQKSNVKVKYDNAELSFGEFSANFSENEFVSANKYLDGVMFTYNDTITNFKLVPSAKSKSYNQSLSSGTGNNTRGPYSLGHGSILEGTEKIWVNEIPVVRGKDYTVDYFEGKITFTNILGPTDNFTYTYEYTNIIDMFFPTVSKRDFFGISASTTMNKLLFESDPVPVIQVASYEAEEQFPSTYTTYESSDLSIPTEEASGIFRLKNKPVVEFSEAVTFNGRLLKNLEDYSINYPLGTIVLFSDDIPSETNPLSVSYNYYGTDNVSETISGIDSKGPYSLKNPRIVKGSESVFVDGVQSFPDLDYLMDYGSGKITFTTKISASSTISIKYAHVKISKVAAADSGNSFKIGGTYLKETAKKGAGSATATIIENHAGSEIKNSLLNLKHFPLDSSQTVTVKVNGIEYTNFYVPTSDAQFLPLPYITDSTDQTDGYATGTLKFNTDLNSSDEVTVLYTYKKSIYGKFTGAGNGSQGPYYLTNITQTVPGSDTSLLVRSEGTAVIETYTKNSSRETLDGRYKINYNYPYVPYVMFNEPFPIEKKFEVTFYYVPSSGSFQDSDLNHDALGVTSSVKISDKALVDVAFGMSRTDQPNISESAQDTITGNNSRGPYSLSHQNIIEGSEKIYVNGFQQNKDIDYFMNYTTGQITFYYLTLKATDAITAQYNYQSTSGISTSTDVRTGKAFRVNAAVKPLESLNISGSFKEIEPDFSPFESTNIGSGSQQKGLNLAYAPKSFFAATGSLLETKNQIGTNKGYYTWTTDRLAGLNMNMLDLASTTLNYRNYKAIDDLVPGATSHSVDTYSNIVSGSLNPKTIEFNSVKFTNKNDFSKNETINNLNSSSTFVNFFHTGNTLNLTDRINFGLDYQFSEPKTLTSEGESSHEISKDYTYDGFWDMKFGFLKNFSARGRIITHDQKNLITDASNNTKNQSINIILDPTSNISTTLDKSRQETLSVRTNGENPRTERNQYTIKYAPFSQLSLNYTNSDDQSLQETGAKSNGINKNISVSFSPLNFLRLSSVWNNQDRNTTAVSGTTEIATNQVTDSRNYTAGLTLRPFNVITLNGDLSVEDYRNWTDTGTINTQTQNVTTKIGASMQPLPTVSISGNYTKKITKDLIKNSETPKENWDSTTTVRVFEWGNLVYNWAQERNMGEVQAGIVTTFDILKITNEISFNTTIPQSSPILSSVVISANYKAITYSDMITASNNFKANSMTFEGTLNF